MATYRKSLIGVLGQKTEQLWLDPKYRQHMSEVHIGQKAWNKGLWKGEKIGYSALHKWVRKQKGKPKECKFCGVVPKSIMGIQWANKSHQYKQDLNDWISLCSKCHSYYDKKSSRNGINHSW